ncbi:MAG: hypothetical protein A3I01_02965 [Betaproteobacteria bacterium RIFCSPLOWO2_02_FULL_65_24]|nr:MAG: hypothetical protein A3I01_02965 [Betaproteobacteria bacterium RIFCSPLOWO2_02_FULL_65_24]OGA95093.1 MAG: hypothetical protein A3G27_19980 [Betaproteobacteria bacterium RIFCSPLOWO2_12_FULL_66_14]
MSLNAIRFLSVVCVALVNVPSGAHLLELPNKLRLSSIDYLVVQQLYQGWAWVGLLVVAALLSTLVLAIALRRQPRALAFATLAFVSIVGAQVVFWVFIFPVNQETGNWTLLSELWMEHRRRWEYSHAVAAALHLFALVCVVLAAVVRDD